MKVINIFNYYILYGIEIRIELKYNQMFRRHGLDVIGI